MGRPFGQHFLRDVRVLDDILRAAAIRPGERVLEIGPGRGVLTEPLAQAVGAEGRVVAVEADPGMAQPLFGRWANVDVVLKDVMRVDLAKVGPFDAVVANLPYQISGPVTALLLDLLEEQGWQRAVLMFQREFGDRIVAGPGTRAFGKLSVQAQRLCEVRKVRDVPPGCFDPPPQVDSVVLHFAPRAQALFAADTQKLRNVLDHAFGQRRKQLRNTLAGLVARNRLEALGVATLRPEQIGVAAWGPIVAAAGGRGASEGVGAGVDTAVDAGADDGAAVAAGKDQDTEAGADDGAGAATGDGAAADAGADDGATIGRRHGRDAGDATRATGKARGP